MFPFPRACSRKQRINIIFTNGYPHLSDAAFSSTPFNHGKMQHSMNTPYARFPSLISFRWLCHSTWLFCFSNMLKIYVFFSKFSAGGLCDWGILLVISLKFQGNKASTVFYDTANYFYSLKNSLIISIDYIINNMT